MFTKADLANHIRQFNITPGDRLVLHASFKSIGPTIHGPTTLINALIDILLPTGALLLPNLNIPHEFSANNPPTFDIKNDPIQQALGIVPQIFKDSYAQHFSLHPTHSMMGVGDLAQEIVKNHHKASIPCGPGTPWYDNAISGGKILLIGVTQKSNTTVHASEEYFPDTFKLTNLPINSTVILDGKSITVRSRLHIWEPVKFDILNDELEQLGYLKRGHVGNAPALCIQGPGFLNLAIEKQKANRYHFLVNEQPRFPLENT